MLEDDSPPQTQAPLPLIFTATPLRMATLASFAKNVAAACGSGWKCTCLPLVKAANFSEGSAIVMLLDPLDDTAGLTTLLDRSDRGGIPILLLTKHSNAHTMGLGAMSMDASMQAIAAAIRGMLSRQSEIENLRAQISGAQHIVGGLRGDLTRMQDELQLAAQVQREFLPKSMPVLPRASVAAMWRPASWVSGDIYDVRRLDEHHLGLFIADAVGHGVPAALMTMVIARSLPTKHITGNTYRIVPPAEALAAVNRELLQRDGHATRFATAVYAILDLRTLRLRVASAGHPAPVVLRGDRCIEFVHSKGGVLGVFEDEQWEETEVDLSSGDRLLLYSDGFEAAFSEDPAASVRDQESIPLHHAAFQSMLQVDDAAELMKRLGERVDRGNISSANADDVTLLVLRVGEVRHAPTDTTAPAPRPSC